MTDPIATPSLRSNDLPDVPFARSAPKWASQQDAGDFAIRLANSSSLGRECGTTVGLMARLGITSSGDWQETEHGCTLHVTANGPGAWLLWQSLWRAITTADVWVSPPYSEPVKLLICDMDSTLIPTESLDELAAHTGIGEKVAEITTRAMNGELDFVAALNERVALLSGLDYSVVETCVRQTEFNPGACELIAHANRAGAETVLISGGFTPFAEFVSQTLGCKRFIANTLDVQDGVLTGKVLDPIVTKDTKLHALEELCTDLGLTPDQACTIGDGANDIPMLVAAGTGVAYRAKQVVKAQTPFHLSHAPLHVLNEWLQWG